VALHSLYLAAILAPTPIELLKNLKQKVWTLFFQAANVPAAV
jgi:hypothetical protein